MHSDLSSQHEAITGLFPQLTHEEAWERYRLSEEQLAHYEEHGFVGGIRILDDEQLEFLRTELAELMTPEHEGCELWYEYNANESVDSSQVLFHALGAWRIKPGMHDVWWNPAFLVPASQLLGGSVRLWHDQLFCKPAGHGGVVAWHQDYSYWTRTTPMAHLTCWIGLDDATTENGCVQYVPGSHRWPLLEITGLAGDMDAIQTVLDDAQKAQFAPVACELKAGEATFHHPLTVHGSYENRSDRPRRAIVLNTFRDGTRSASDTPMLDGTSVIAKGEPMQGQFYPLLWNV